jgi:hypothetical protein
MTRTAPWLRSTAAARVLGAATLVLALAIVEGLIRAGVINRFIVPLPSQILAALPRIVAEENVLHRFWQTTQEVLWASLLIAVVGIALGALLYRVRVLRDACESWVGALASAPGPETAGPAPAPRPPGPSPAPGRRRPTSPTSRETAATARSNSYEPPRLMAGLRRRWRRGCLRRTRPVNVP